MNTDINDLIHNSKRLLIIPEINYDLDSVFSAFALSQSLKKISKSSAILIKQDMLADQLKKYTSYEQINIINNNEKKGIVVTLENINSEINTLNWNKTDGRLSIFINSDTELNENMNVSLDKRNFEAYIILKISEKELIKSERKVVINPIGENNQDTRTKTFAQSIYDFLKRYNLPIDEIIAKYLLKGFRIGTSNFTINLNNQTFPIIAKLSKNISYQTLSTSFMDSDKSSKLTSIIYKNIKKEQAGIYYSFADIKNNTPVLGLISDPVPFTDLEELKVGFCLYIGDNKVEVYIKTLSSEINLKKQLEHYAYIGTSQKGKVLFKNTDQDYIIQNIISSLKTQISYGPPRKSKQEVQKNEPQKIQHEEVTNQSENSKVVEDKEAMPEQLEKLKDKQNKKQKENKQSVSQYEEKAKSNNIFDSKKKVEVTVKDEKSENVKNSEEEVKIRQTQQIKPLPEHNTSNGFLNKSLNKKYKQKADDPLKPAVDMPKPMRLGEENLPEPKIVPQSPLPPAQ